ncbi:hypothetical protein SAMN05421796_1147 [Chryseobacterium piscicola]|uniref:Uncharacterized protein n=1 Tax=Chryseobacterium piscicola TaxID=551459 RepID=A0A1N7PFQ9_9FLAO|nr:hypothetical protein SAMN05421796_1147 [Chryseobacterium piscicola]
MNIRTANGLPVSLGAAIKKEFAWIVDVKNVALKSAS